MQNSWLHEERYIYRLLAVLNLYGYNISTYDPLFVIDYYLK